MLSWKRIAWVNETDSSFTHGWCFWGDGAHTLDNNLLSASVPSHWLWEGLSLSQKRHIARTEYSFQCTCSRTTVFCNIDASGFAYRLTKCLDIPSPDALVTVVKATQAVTQAVLHTRPHVPVVPRDDARSDQGCRYHAE